MLLTPVDNLPLTSPLPGQFVVLRLRPGANAPTILRSYSLSGLPNDDRYRITVKIEPNGLASTFVSTQLHAGDIVEISAPRGAFVLQPGERPVVLISAGIGVTPVMAMLHSLVAGSSPRRVWWLYGARDGSAHPFAHETRDLIAKLQHAQSYVAYSRPTMADRHGIDFDATGRLTVEVLEQLGIPREADFYLCGPRTFLDDFIAGLITWGVALDCVHTEIFGSTASIMPGMNKRLSRAPHAPAGSPATGQTSHSLVPA